MSQSHPGKGLRELPGSLLMLFAAATGVFLPGSGAEELELLTDRPDFTETSVVVPPGRLQIESGCTYARGEARDRTWNLPETLLRFGVAPRWEARLELPDYATGRNGTDLNGWTDLSIGAKYQLRPSGARVTMALIPMISLPTGENDFSSDEVDASLAWTWATDLSATRSLAGLVGLSWPTEGGDRNFTLTTTLAWASSLDARLGVFVEAFADFPEHGSNQPGLHTGFTYLLQPNLQVDLHGGVGLSSSDLDYFLGAGLGAQY